MVRFNLITMRQVARESATKRPKGWTRIRTKLKTPRWGYRKTGVGGSLSRANFCGRDIACHCVNTGPECSVNAGPDKQQHKGCARTSNRQASGRARPSPGQTGRRLATECWGVRPNHPTVNEGFRPGRQPTQ